MPSASRPSAVRRALSRLAPGLRPQSIRGVLIAGFAVVFALWVVSGYELVRRLHALEQRTATEHETALRAGRALSTIRTNVLLGSIYLRDAIIDNRSVNAEVYRQELLDIRGEIDTLLPAALDDLESPEERRHWTQLQRELDQFWQSRELAYSPGASLNTSEAASILLGRAVPSRTTILQMIDRLSELQLLSQRRREAEASTLYIALRNRLLLIGAFAILVGLIVASLATSHVSRLERQLEQQGAAEQRTRRELEWLSARLVSVQEEERRSLARELHDEVGQALTAIKMDVAVALRGVDPRRAAEPDVRIASWLEDARTIAETTLQNVRDLSQLLHPSMLDDFGLPEALRSYLRTYSRRTGIGTQFDHEGAERRLPAQVEVCMYRIAQEALTNVARHSGARNVIVTLSQADETLDMTIEDDGRGIDPNVSRLRSASAPGLGLIGMRERAQTLRGTFLIQPRPEGGTRVAVRLPTPRPAAERIEPSHAERLAV